MEFRTTRLTLAEWLLGGSALLLLVDLFGLIWFAYKPHLHAIMRALGQVTSANGWDTFSALGPLVLVVCSAGLAVVLFSATRRSPAVPVVIATLALPVSFVQMLLVAIRVLIDQPSVTFIPAHGNAIEARPGAYVGLILSILVFAGFYLVLRRDGVAPADSPAVIEALSVEESPSESHA